MSKIYIALYIVSCAVTFLTCFGWIIAEIKHTSTFSDEFSLKKELGQIFIINFLACWFSLGWLVICYGLTGMAHYGWTLKIKK